MEAGRLSASALGGRAGPRRGGGRRSPSWLRAAPDAGRRKAQAWRALKDKMESPLDGSASLLVTMKVF